MAAGAEVHELVARRLADNDQRYTSGRRQLVETLHAMQHPATLPDILAITSGLVQSSAYRNLESLERCGVVRRLHVAGDRAHYELAEPLVHHHHHLICVSCGRVMDVELDGDREQAVLAPLVEAASAVGFTPVDHTLDLHGYCADCGVDGAPS